MWHQPLRHSTTSYRKVSYNIRGNPQNCQIFSFLASSIYPKPLFFLSCWFGEIIFQIKPAYTPIIWSKCYRSIGSSVSLPRVGTVSLSPLKSLSSELLSSPGSYVGGLVSLPSVRGMMSSLIFPINSYSACFLRSIHTLLTSQEGITLRVKTIVFSLVICDFKGVVFQCRLTNNYFSGTL